jgi:hypothetical protein
MDGQRPGAARDGASAAAREGELWVVLAKAVGLPSLGDAAAARARLVARATAEGDTSATLAWLLALSAPSPTARPRRSTASPPLTATRLR